MFSQLLRGVQTFHSCHLIQQDSPSGRYSSVNTTSPKSRSIQSSALSCCFNVFGSDRSLRLQIQLVNDDEKFTCYSPQGPTGATALLTVLKKAQSCVQERRRSMSR